MLSPADQYKCIMKLLMADVLIAGLVAGPQAGRNLCSQVARTDKSQHTNQSATKYPPGPVTVLLSTPWCVLLHLATRAFPIPKYRKKASLQT